MDEVSEVVEVCDAERVGADDVNGADVGAVEVGRLLASQRVETNVGILRLEEMDRERRERGGEGIVWKIAMLRCEGRMSWKQVREHFRVEGASVYGWVMGDERRRAEYQMAVSELADDVAMETLGIADSLDREPGCRMVSIKARQWLAERLSRERYGSGPGVAVAVGVTINLTQDDVGLG
jgi:hypothetical protein